MGDRLWHLLRGESWTADVHTAETYSTVTLRRLLDKLWRDRPGPRRPLLEGGGMAG